MKRGPMLSDKDQFDMKRARRDSGYSTESETDGSPHKDDMELGSFHESESGETSTIPFEMYPHHEEHELFCLPSSANTLWSDSLHVDTCSKSNSLPLSAGATNIFIGSFANDFVEKQPTSHIAFEPENCASWSDAHFESDGFGYPDSSSAMATNFPSLFTDHFFLDEANNSPAVPVVFPVIPLPNNTSCNGVIQSSPFVQEIKPEKLDRKYLSKAILPESACVTNLEVKPIIYNKINGTNFEVELSEFLQNAHATEKFKLAYGKRSKTVSLIDLAQQDFRDLVNREGSVSLSKITPDVVKSKKFASIEKKSKRSLASCQSVTRGLALAEKFEEIQALALDSKTKNNRFTNYQRKDRSTGAKLEKEYLEKNNLSKFASYSDIERQCKTSLAIFDSEGFFKYLSPKFCKKIVFFFEDEDDMYFVKSLKGFSRVE